MSENLFDLSGKVIIVTGGSRGLGRDMAHALARAGATVAVTARRVEDCAATVSSITDSGGRAVAFALDVRSEPSITTFAEAVAAEFGHVDVLVNNAGCNIRKPLLEVTWDDWSTVVDTNLRGTFFVSKAILPLILKQAASAGESGRTPTGRVINIGSVTAVFGYAGIVPYCASRGGVLQMTKAMADEFGPKGITVNCLAPGWFKTEQTKALYENPQWLAYLVDRIPARRPGRPDDLDGAVVFLASDASQYITGQILLVDGGISTGATRATLQRAE